MVKIPSSTIRQEESPPAVASEDGVGAQQTSNVEEPDAEGGEAASVAAAAGAMSEPGEAAVAEEPTEGPAGTPNASGVPSVPEPSPVPFASAEPPPPRAPSVPTVTDDRVAFKVVLTLKPAEEGRWHATIAVGRDGCDPYWEPADVDDWRDALDGVLGVQAAAEVRWAEQPRNRPALHLQGSRTGGKATPASTTPPVAGKTSRTAGKAAAGGEADASRKRSAPDAPGEGKATPPAASTPTDGTVQRAEERRQSPPPPIGGVEKLALF